MADDLGKNPARPDPSREPRTRGYEPSRLKLRWVVLFVAGFVAFAAVTHVWVWFLWRADANGARPPDRPRSVAADSPAPPPADAPPL